MRALIVNPRASKQYICNTIGDKECLGFAKLLYELGYDVDYLKNKYMCPDREYYNIVVKPDINSYDKVFLYNFQPNFYGGKYNSFIIDIYFLLAKYTGNIYYMFVDCGIKFKQIFPSQILRWDIFKKNPKSTYTINNIIYMSQGYDFNITKKTIGHVNGVNKDVIKYFPFYLTTLLYDNISLSPIYNYPREFDLYYGGSFRKGNRTDKFIKYFFNNTNIRVGLYGTIESKNFVDIADISRVKFNPPVIQQEIIEENKKGFATIVLSENKYNNNMLTLRIFESILANMVVFIDEPFDSNHVIYKNYPILEKYVYVNTGKELEDKIIELKTNKELYNAIINEQHKFFRDMLNMDNLKQLLRSAIDDI